jgi:hypothetical protein
MANPNIVNVTDIRGKTAVQAVGTGATAIVSNTADSGKVFKINSLTIANVDGVNSANISVDLFRSSVAYEIAHTIEVPADSTLVVISKDTSIYLEEGDSLRCTASVASDLEAICSYEEIS